MKRSRVNIGIIPNINKIINDGAFEKGESRSGVIRLAIKQRYPLKKLEPVEGPFTMYVRVNIPMDGVAYVRKLAHINNLPISSIYCAIIKKYLQEFT